MDTNLFLEITACNIMSYRLASEMKQQRLAKLANITQRTVSMLENGLQKVTLPVVVNTARVFGCKVSDILPSE